MTERWLPVPGYEGLYEVSDRGRVRSLDRVVNHASGPSRRKGVMLRSMLNGGRQQVSLWRDGQRKMRFTHHLVLEAFVGPRPEGLECLHWDDDPANNRLENLRWGTSAENKHDAVRNGKHGNTKKTHCPDGHEYTPENTIVPPSRPSARYCRKCNQRRGREYMRKKRAARKK